MIYVQDSDLVLHQGDVREVLRSLPAESVHCVVTSPPYWGLRDYGTGAWEGGDAECDHLRPGTDGPKDATSTLKSRASNQNHEREPWPHTCGKCGARRIDNQLGLEPTPEQYVSNMVEVFREVRRVLRKDGTCWLNLGDSYNSAASNDWSHWKGGQTVNHGTRGAGVVAGLKPKDLCMIPARLALALQADGWYLRSQIVWSKPNPMPESVTDRPTTSHEFVYLLAKSPRYFFDQEAVREPHTDALGIERFNGRGGVSREDYDAKTQGWNEGGMKHRHREYHPAGRNLRSVWEIATQPYPEAHFATYPEELVRRCILAGTSEKGSCPECGAPWAREVAVERGEINRIRNVGGRTDGFTQVRRPPGASDEDMTSRRTTTGWISSCKCGGQGRRPAPCTVLDPFFGSGTTGLVARKHGRRTIGIELSPSYCALAARRLQQLSLLAEVAEPPPQLTPHKGLTGGAYSPPGQSPHSNAREKA